MKSLEGNKSGFVGGGVSIWPGSLDLLAGVDPDVLLDNT
jgi:hypothetical protein